MANIDLHNHGLLCHKPAPGSILERGPCTVLDGLNILLVEDDVLILLDLKASLENAGANVTTASSLRAALKYCEADYAAAILDIRLPDGEVFPAAERLAQARIPIIFHSGNAGCDSARAHFPDAAALSKPVQEQVLIATVQQRANRRRG